MKVVYSMIFGNYEVYSGSKRFRLLKELGWDFVLFTNNREIHSDDLVRVVHMDVKYGHARRTVQEIKMRSHLYLSEYVVAIYVNFNINLSVDFLLEMEKQALEYDCVFKQHPKDNCIYSHANTIYLVGYDTYTRLKRQVHKYKDRNYPRNNGLIEGCTFLRKHNPVTNKLFEYWLQETFVGSLRDQLAFNYVYWTLRGEDRPKITVLRNIFEFNQMLLHGPSANCVVSKNKIILTDAFFDDCCFTDSFQKLILDTDSETLILFKTVPVNRLHYVGKMLEMLKDPKTLKLTFSQPAKTVTRSLRNIDGEIFLSDNIEIF